MTTVAVPTAGRRAVLGTLGGALWLLLPVAWSAVSLEDHRPGTLRRRGGLLLAGAFEPLDRVTPGAQSQDGGRLRLGGLGTSQVADRAEAMIRARG
ncbi:MAG: hypothetical protein ACLGI3_06730, partial [Actinomycetes bacterium]